MTGVQTCALPILLIGIVALFGAYELLAHRPAPHLTENGSRFSLVKVHGLIAQDYAFATNPDQTKLVQVMVSADVERVDDQPLEHCAAELQTGSRSYPQLPEAHPAALPATATSFGPYWFLIARRDYTPHAQLRLRCDDVATDWLAFEIGRAHV